MNSAGPGLGLGDPDGSLELGPLQRSIFCDSLQGYWFRAAIVNVMQFGEAKGTAGYLKTAM